jgi:hypothetical protein
MVLRYYLGHLVGNIATVYPLPRILGFESGTERTERGFYDRLSSDSLGQRGRNVRVSGLCDRLRRALYQARMRRRQSGNRIRETVH